MNRLLLFTNEYPYPHGDAAFVAAEIEALAEAFDEVVVFCTARRLDGELMGLPPGVRFGGNLRDASTVSKLRWMLFLSAWLSLATAAWHELRTGRLSAHPLLFAKAASAGLSLAYDRRVERAGGGEAVAYAFWAMGTGLALPWLRRPRARVLRVHRYDLYEDQSTPPYLPYRPFLYSRADRVLAISDDAVEYLRRHPETAGKVVLSRLGASGPNEWAPARTAAEVLVVSCSSVTEVKRVDRILETVARLPSAGVALPIRWVHFGDGPELDSLRSRLPSVPAGVTIELRGGVSHDAIMEFYSRERATVFLNLSSSEGVPVSIMEAIAFDVPVVATAVGGTPEIVGPSHGTGELVGADAPPQQVAETVHRVLTAPAGVYRPRRFWAAEFDARLTGARAARLIRGAGGGFRPGEAGSHAAGSVEE